MMQPTHARMPRPLRIIQALLLLATMVFLALHWVHLTADFPNYSPWMDWSKYTDEGWYGDAAIRHFDLGHWNVPGDFNPGVALPVWPLLEFLVFKFTGVSLVAARSLTVAVFGLTLGSAFLLLRRWSPHHGGLAPAIAVTLLAVSPFCFVFTRMAILEPMLVLLMLTSLLAASNCAHREHWWPPLLLGLTLPIMVLTKTTAIFLFPAIAWMLWAAVGYRLKPFLKAGLIATAAGGLLWGLYFTLFVRPHFLVDYHYLFSANAYTGITRQNAAEVLLGTVKDGMWMGQVLYPLSLVAAIIGLGLFFRTSPPHSESRHGDEQEPQTTRTNALIPVFLLWASGYTAFLAYHANLQPRYYLVVAIPLTLLVPVVFEEVWRRPVMSGRHRLMTVSAVACMALILGLDGHQTLSYVRHPEYTLIEAARGVKDVVAREQKANPKHSTLVLSISGSDLSLMTGLPSICDDFGTLELSDRVKAYHPGWYAAWNQVDDDKMDALTPEYHLERVAAFPAMDDPDRNLLILYRLDPPLQTTLRHRKRKAIPRRLQTRIGQQPSTTQLAH